MPPPAPAHASLREVLRVHAPMAVAGVIVFAVFETIAVVRTDASGVSYAAIMILLFVVVAIADRWVGFSAPVLWCLVAWAALHMAGGLIPVGTHGVLYNQSLWIPGIRFDRVVHAFGFGTATVACWQALRRYPLVPEPTVGLVVLAALAGLGLGAINETVEFIFTRISASTAIGGYTNTGYDLIANTIGATAAAAWIFARGAGDEARSGATEAVR